MEAVRTSETSVDNHFTRQYNPEDSSEHHTRRRENLKSHDNSRYLQPSVGCSCTNPPSGSRQFSYKRISGLYSISDIQGSVLGKPLKSRCNNRTVPASQMHITGTGLHFQHIKFKKLLNVHTKFHKNWATGSKAEKGTHNVHKRMLSLTHTHRCTYAGRAHGDLVHTLTTVCSLQQILRTLTCFGM
jgi:hypothetical protein